MFLKKQLEDRRETLLKSLGIFSTEEELEFLAANKIITSGTEEEKKDFSKNQLADYSPSFVFKCCAKSPDFHDFCGDDRYYHLQKWGSELQKKQYPGEKIISVDGEDRCTITDQYIGAYFMSQYNYHKNIAQSKDLLLAKIYLDMACTLGLFHALAERCQLNRATLKNENVRDDEATDARVQLRQDAKILKNLYWAPGGSVAYPILLDIGNYYANKDDVNLAVMAEVFHKDAAEIFLWAKELASYKPPLLWNIKVTTMIYGEAKLAQVANLDWKGLKQFILNHIDDRSVSHIEFCSKITKQVNDLVSVQSERTHIKKIY